MEDSLVSIIVPAYKAAEYLSATVNSVQAQTYSAWEMLIADDCSPDNTRHIVEKLSFEDQRIRLIRLPVNSGPARARNAALSEAQGRWIAFLDSDDLWLPEKLEKSLAFAKRHDAALVYTGYRRIDAQGRRVGKYIPVPKYLTYHQLLGNTAIATSTVVIDRKRAGNIKMQSVYYDDFVCWLSILESGMTAYGLNEDLMRYRILPKSVSRNKHRSAAEVWKIYRSTLKFGRLAASWYFFNYAWHALLKYRKF